MSHLCKHGHDHATPEGAAGCPRAWDVLLSDDGTNARNACGDNSPPWFTGRWRDWHRGHGCSKDDGRPRSANAKDEIARFKDEGGAMPMSEFEAERQELIGQRDLLRSALAKIVGVDGREELEAMEAVMRLMPAPAEDKATTVDAIHALLSTLPNGTQA